MKHADAQVLLDLFANQPLAIVPDRLTTLRALARDAEAVTEEEVRAALGAAAARGRREAPAGVAVIPIIGTIVPRASEIVERVFGLVSAERIRGELAAAVADKSVKHIVLHMDTPGGNVAGTPELARAVFEARQVKPITAVADSLMASAGYWIGTAASEVVVSPSGEVGSIGVIALHADWHRLFADFGIDITVLREPSTKAEGDPFSPLTDSARAAFQQQLREVYDDFVAAVAEHRGVSPSAVRSGFAQGRTALAKRALAEGMVDRIATLDQVIAEIGDRPARGRARAEADVAPEDARIAAGDAGLSISTAIQVESPFKAVDELIDVLKRHGLAGAAPTTPDADEAEAERDVEAAVWAEQQDTATQDAASTETVAAEGAAADAAEDPPTQPAPGASEEAMPEETLDTAARKGAADPAEQARRKEIRQLGRDYNIDAEIVDQWVDNGASVEAVQAEIFRRMSEREKASPRISVGADREAERPFASLGEQLQAIRLAGNPANAPDKRLLHLNEQAARYAAATGTSTVVPSDAGFVIQPDFSEGIVSHMWNEGRVLARTNNIPIGPNANRFKRTHLAENSRRAGSRYGGVRVYWAAEANTVESSRPKTRQQEISLEKLMGLWYVTEETLEDAVALTAEGERAFRRELTFVAEDAIFRGDGAGKPLGFLKSGALVTATAQETDAQKGRISPLNIGRMVAQYAGSLQSGVWYIHRQLVPELMVMAVGATPVFIPNQNISGAGFGTLLGMPVEISEYCEAPGTPGDICLVDLSQYTTIDKRGVRWENSIHVRFIYDESVFKIVYRLNGQPDWETSIQQYKGSDPISPFVVLGPLGS